MCASTRAVHLELTPALSVESSSLAFRRFTSWRGLPAAITSDNAKTFRSSSQDIQKITRAEEVRWYLTNKQITWNFIVEKGPLVGGFWEWLVRSIKKPFKKILGRSTLSFDDLRTVLVEIEGVVNSRPLTYVYDDEESISYPLTPSDLIYGRWIMSTPNAAHYELISTNQSLARKLCNDKHVLQQLTNQWRWEYSIELFQLETLSCWKMIRRVEPSGSLERLKNLSPEEMAMFERLLWKLSVIWDVLLS